MTSPSLHDVVADPGDHTVAELLDAHTAQLATVVEAVGVEHVVEAVDLSNPTVEAIADGDVTVAADLDVEAVASVLALADESADPGAILADAREALLFGMTAGVLNVDAVAGDVSVDLEPREVQGMVEGRYPMTLREYVALQRVIAGHAS